jgi:predicted cupin superfamily sugar epimerase/mannose-6-phosphate isomerase-like protein (cupin superfamily)
MMLVCGSKTVLAEGMDIFKGACGGSRQTGNGHRARLRVRARALAPGLALALALAVRCCTATAADAGAADPHSAALQAISPPPSGVAGRLIAHFKMRRIPEEGAWYAVTYTSEDVLDGGLLPPRYAGHPHAAGGAIVALVTAQDFSAMHRLQTDEVWHFYSGAPLRLLLLYPDGTGGTVTLGPNVLGGELAQFPVPKGVWQGAAPLAETAGAFSFVGTQMAPAFDPGDFEIGYRDQLQRRYPAFAADIRRLTRAEFAKTPGRPASGTESPVLSRAFTAQDVPALMPSPGVSLQELVGRVAPLAKTAMLSVAKFTLLPGRSSGTSYNRYAQEVFLVTDGTGAVHLRDTVTSVSAESTVFIPAGEVHSIEADPDSSLTFYAISAPAFSPEDYVMVKSP